MPYLVVDIRIGDELHRLQVAGPDAVLAPIGPLQPHDRVSEYFQAAIRTPATTFSCFCSL